MSTTKLVTEPKTETPAKKEKRKLTAEQQRQQRKRLAAKRKERILAAGKERLKYVQNQGSMDAVHEAEKYPNKNPDTSSTQNSDQYMNNNNNTNIRDVLNQTNNPFMMGPTGMPNMSNMPNMPNIGNLPPINPNMNMNDVMGTVMDGVFGLNQCNQTMEEIIEKRKKEANMNKYDNYAHNIFCVLFVLLLVFLPYQYDVTIFNYSLSSDAWTFFIAFEIILFSIFYGYQRYLQRKYNPNQQQTNDPFGGGQLMPMIGGIFGASFFGQNQGEISKFIQKWINRAMMLWIYIKMLRRLMSDLCLILFLWIVLTAIKSVFVG